MGTSDTGDKLGENDGFAQTGTSEQTGLTTADERCEQVDDLDAGFEDFGFGGQIGDGGASRWMGQYSSACTGPRLSMGSPSRLNTRPSVGLPTGTVTGPPVSTTFHAADHAFGVAQGDAAYTATAKVLLHFASEVNFCAFHVGIDFDGVINGWKMVFGKFDVEGRPDDLSNVADLLGAGTVRRRVDW